MISTSPMQFLQRAGIALILATAWNLHSAVGPDYQRPTNAIPETFDDAQYGSWKAGQPADTFSRGEWWVVFNDANLNELQDQALSKNQDLRAAAARVEQARATARQAKADFFPSISLDPSYNRTRYSPNAGVEFPVRYAHNIHVPFDLTYELDLWGRVRRSFESATRDSEARLAAFESIRLALHAEVAQNYFAIRALDAEVEILR